MARLLVIVPAYNEATGIETTVETILSFFRGQPEYETTLVVADSSDRDGTRAIVSRLAEENPDLEHHQFPDGTGRGKKVREAALGRPHYQLYASIDADLPITMNEFGSIVGAIEGAVDVAAASKYVRGASSNRPLHRVLISRLGNRLFNLFLQIPVHDFLAGAKAWNQSVTAQVLPTVLNDEFFFDTELLFRTHRAGKRIVEVPVRYVDRRVLTSKVNLGKLGIEFTRNTYSLLTSK
jgi:glycosyltransferase involved in cell wall biosynthesis